MSETVNRLLAESVLRFHDLPALAGKRAAAYQRLTYREMGERVRAFADGLSALGLRRGDAICIVSENRPEWVIADLGILSLGAVNVPLFTTSPAAQIEYIVRDSGAGWMIVSGEARLKKALAVRARVPQLRIIAIDSPADAARGIIAFTDVIELGNTQRSSDADFEARRESIGPDDLASIVYTSGTTGDPKGVMLTHGNFASNVRGCCAAIAFGRGDVVLSLLPLNHCLERVAACYAPLACGAMIAYAESLRRLRENMREVEPTFMILVPRIYEAIEESIRDRAARATGLRRRLFERALAAGEARVMRLQRGGRATPLTALREWLADRLVLSGVRRALGLRRSRFLVSGAAPLGTSTARFFHAIGLPVYEGYGLTEAAPVITVNRIDRWKIGTVGLPLEGVEVRIAGNGEVLCRGANVMRGYHGQPDATADVIDAQGWLHTGDVGELDPDGFLRITDRIKDLIVLRNGKKVSPQRVEMQLGESPYIDRVVLVGEGRATVGALIVPDFARLGTWAREQGIALPEDPAAVCALPQVERLFRAEIARLSADLAEHERVRGFALLERDFTVEAEELTPTLKVRRRVIIERHAGRIAALYPRD
jgi:long-chain acyl-CoA synthetase